MTILILLVSGLMLSENSRAIRFLFFTTTGKTVMLLLITFPVLPYLIGPFVHSSDAMAGLFFDGIFVHSSLHHCFDTKIQFFLALLLDWYVYFGAIFLLFPSKTLGKSLFYFWIFLKGFELYRIYQFFGLTVVLLSPAYYSFYYRAWIYLRKLNE